MYQVNVNLNTPKEEDFTFLVTALWHWYEKHPPSSITLIQDPNEMIQQETKVMEPRLLTDGGKQIQALIEAVSRHQEERKGEPELPLQVRKEEE